MTISQISQLRSLMERYYDGLTSLDEERSLIRMVAEARPDEIPADLREDAALLRALSLQAEAAKAVEAVIAAQAAQPAPVRRPLFRRWMVAAAAALIAVVATVGFRLMSRPDDVVPELKAPVAQVVTPAPVPAPPAEAPAVEAVKAPAAAPAASVRRRVQPEAHKAGAEASAPHSVEITDSAQAAGIIRMVCGMLADNLSSGISSSESAVAERMAMVNRCSTRLMGELDDIL